MSRKRRRIRGAGQAGRLPARERSGHLAYINLFPTYANSEQLGTKGDVETAYREHLQQFVDVVKPALISYDHYHFLRMATASSTF